MCPAKELAQLMWKFPVLLEVPLRRSCVKSNFLFLVDVGNLMNAIKHHAVRADWLFVLRIKVYNFCQLSLVGFTMAEFRWYSYPIKREHLNWSQL